MIRRRIVVVGGGAAGLMAAGQAAEAGADILLLEKMKGPGRKLCITGKGRCNITNVADPGDFIVHFSSTGTFLRQAFSRFCTTELTDFFKERGLELVTERGGRVFPASSRAQDVVTVFMHWLKQCGVKITLSSRVERLMISRGSVSGVVSRRRKIACDAVILATGGAAYPATGSTGDGYRLAKEAGHHTVPVRPALVPLETSGSAAEKMAGLTLRNISVRMLVDNRKRKEVFGEMLFMKFGVGGPAILTLSGDAVDAMRGGHKIILSIDLKPALDEKKLAGRLQRDFASRGREQYSSFLRGLLPREMISVCTEMTGVAPSRQVRQITAQERRCLRTWLKDFRLEVTGHRPFAEAIITAGGIDTREINPRTMESRLTKGLFFAGELLNVHADTGGYNLQAAFSTGWLAGRCAARST